MARKKDRKQEQAELPDGVTLRRVLRGHSGEVYALAVTPDGRQVVSGSQDKTLKVWDLEIGSELRTLSGHSGAVWAVAVTPDGRQVVSGSGDKTLKVWDLETGSELHTLSGHSDWVNAVAVTPDGRQVVSGSADKTLKVWDLETGSELHTLSGHSVTVFAVAVTPDGRQVVSGSGDKTLKVWDLETGSELHTLSGHSREVYAVAVTPDGRQVVSAGETGVELHSLDQTLPKRQVKKRTLANLSCWRPVRVEALRCHSRLRPRLWPALRAQDLKLALFLVLARLAHQGSRLSAVRWAADHRLRRGR